MTKTKLLCTAAAAVILSVGAASAQSAANEAGKKAPQSQQMKQSDSRSQDQSATKIGKNEIKNRRSGAEQPSTTGQGSAQDQSGENRGSAEKSGAPEQAGKTEPNSPSAAKNNASDNKSGTTGQADQNASETQKSSAEKAGASHTAARPNEATKESGSKKSGINGESTRNEPHNSATPNAKDKNGGKASETQQSQQNSGTTKPNAARQAAQTHQANTNAQTKGVKLTAEQQHKVQQTVFASSSVPRAEHVDFAVDVGTVVPSHVHVVEVPQTLVEIHPEWRGDEYLVVRDEIVIVNHSRKIVAVIPAGEHHASTQSSTTIVDLTPDEIREVQTVLIRDGYLNGDADGVFGPKTREALIEFQRHEGIQVTGHIDRKTVTSLGLSQKIQVGGTNTRGGASGTVGQGTREPNAARQNEPESNKAQTAEPKHRASEPKARNSSAEKPHEQSTTGQGKSIKPNANAAQPDNKSMQPEHDESERRTAPSTTTGQGAEQPSSEAPVHKYRNGEKDRSSK